MAEVPGGHLDGDGRSVIVHLVPGTPETGQWCDHCLLPSVIRIPVYMLTGDGPQLLATYTECDGCGGHPGIAPT